MNISLPCSILSILGFVMTGILLLAAPPASAGTQVLSEATIEADAATVLEITSTFDQAEEAIRSRDLEGLMALYAQDYRYHGIGKDGVRKIWADLFTRYAVITNIHAFSSITISGSGPKRIVQITCTGALHGATKNSKKPIPIDSWYREIHYLVKEQGTWRILGSQGGEAPAVLPFGTAPHPLF